MTQTYCLSENLDSASASTLAADLLKHQGQPLCIDASDVSFAGTLALQVLVAAHRQWQDDGHNLQIASISAELADSAKGLGIDLSAIGAADPDVVQRQVS